MAPQEDSEHLRSTFDGVASFYDETRPSYPEQLFDDLMQLTSTGMASKALEIGCGTGQATMPLARRGYEILGIELGENLATVARSKTAEYPNARVLNSSFEDWPLWEKEFDLVVSATAFHWIDPEVRYVKSAEALKVGGSLALIWQRPEPEESTEGFSKALSDIRRREVPELAVERRPRRLDCATDKADDIQRSGCFERPAKRFYRFGIAHDAESYLRLISTYSSHRALDEMRRQQLFAAVARLINEEYGGEVIEGYRSELYVARRL